jgi:hypothetical protein
VTRLDAARILSRRDPIADSFLSQAARAADGLPGGAALQAAASVARAVDVSGSDPTAFAARKLAQALCRLAIQESQAALLR